MQIINLLAELIPCLSIGYLLARFKPSLSQAIARPLIDFGIPISLMGLLLKSRLALPLLEALAIALVAIGIVMTILNCIPILKRYIPSQVLKLGSGFGNTGYFGIPVSLALLPNQALIYSIGFDLGATLVIWSLGPLLISNNSRELKGKEYWRRLIKAFANSPAIKGLIGALLISSMPWREQITTLLWIPSKIVIVLALVVVGMRLGWLKTSTYSTIISQVRAIQTSLFVKLIGLPSLMFSICFILRVPNIMREALVLQAAAPTAISVLLIAQAQSQDDEKATSLVIFSTITALITIPIWAIILKF
mgnify:CR=1 FL=1